LSQAAATKVTNAPATLAIVIFCVGTFVFIRRKLPIASIIDGSIWPEPSEVCPLGPDGMVDPV
jgi:hypothetical protein